MNPTPRIVVVGSINMDLVIECRRIPVAGETVLARGASEVCGGKGANQAVAASMAGADVTLIGRVGMDAFRERLLANLQARRVDIEHVRTSENVSSGLAVISVEQSGQNAITVVPGANGQVTPQDVRESRSVIEASDLLMLQLEIPIDAVIEAIRIARAAGVRVMLDPAPVPDDDHGTGDRMDGELMNVDLICPNESEASALVGHRVDDAAQAESAARQLHRRGAASVAITMGDRGTMLLHDDRATMIPAFPVDAVDTTAAGDAFAGALAVDWAQHGCAAERLVESTRFANAAGALAACRHGAQPSMATRNEIEKLWRSR